jgi:hypothetical protein
MKSKLAKILVTVLLAVFMPISFSAPAQAATSCDLAASSATSCFIATNDAGSTYYGHAGDFYACELTYYNVKINDGYDRIKSIEISGVSASGKINPGSSISASVYLDQECVSWAKAYDIELELVGLANKPLSGTKVSDEFTYRKKLSGRLDSYCFTETCGYSLMTFDFAIPADFKRDLLTLRAKVFAKTVFSRPMLQTSFVYSDVLASGEPIMNPNLANLDVSMSEVDGRIVCFISDASEMGIQKFGINGFEFEVVQFVGAAEYPLDKGTWSLGTPPNNYRKTSMSHGDEASAVVQGVVFHTYHFTEEKKGTTYGCKVRATTVIGASPWNTQKLTASRTVIRGYVQALPNVKVLCARLNKTYPGGVALSSAARNLGAKITKKPKVSASVYRANSELDMDSDGIICER